MKKGEHVRTPQFLTVKIEKVFRCEANARKNGFTEPTHYKNDKYGIIGKSLGLYHMEFAVYKK